MQNLYVLIIHYFFSTGRHGPLNSQRAELMPIRWHLKIYKSGKNLSHCLMSLWIKVNLCRSPHFEMAAGPLQESLQWIVSEVFGWTIRGKKGGDRHQSEICGSEMWFPSRLILFFEESRRKRQFYWIELDMNHHVDIYI